MKCMLLLLLFISGFTFAQVNDYFENNPQWTVYKVTYPSNDCYGAIQITENYTIDGDTLLGPLVYKKVYNKGVYETLNLSCMVVTSSFFINPNPIFYLRSNNKKMYMNYGNGASDILLYDFNLSIGDTLPDTYTHNSSTTGYPMHVTSIDSILTPNGYLKKFALDANTSSEDTLYEGIGSTGGLINSIFPLFLSGGHFLKCYSLNGVSYLSFYGVSCNLSLDFPEIIQNKSSQVFPNPFNDKTEFRFSTTMENTSLELYNIRGQKVRSIVFSGKSLIFEKDELMSGIYYYIVKNDFEMLVNGKLIVE